MRSTESDSAPQPDQPRLLTAVLWIIIVVIAFWFLTVAKGFLIPLVIAIIAFYLVQVLNSLWKRLPIFRNRVLPEWVATVLSALVIVGLMFAFGTLVANNAIQVANASERYQAQFEQLYRDVLGYFGLEGPELFEQILDRIDLSNALANVAGGLAGLAGNGALVLMYLAFLLLERPFLEKKLNAIVPDESRRRSIIGITEEIDQDVRVYIGVKSAVSLITASGSYAIMKLVGLDFAEFWALLIFVFNFIPNIGSLIATVLPSLLSLVQFDSVRPFLTVAVGVTAVQLTMGNFIEPAFMGNRLNISPLVVILSLVLWGLLWGVTGMFLCVPITVISMIIFSHFDTTRWIAILLSRDGRVRGDPVGDTDAA